MIKFFFFLIIGFVLKCCSFVKFVGFKFVLIILKLKSYNKLCV